MTNNYVLVVFNGIICKWGAIKDIAEPADVRLATTEEYKEYYKHQ